MKQQQEQALQYFNTTVEGWQQKSVNQAGKFSIVEGRNSAVLDVVKHKKAGTAFLDVGCGTGQLVIDAAKLGWTAEGVDFAPEMIAQCDTEMSRGTRNRRSLRTRLKLAGNCARMGRCLAALKKEMPRWSY